jgi:hypothetical protein
MDAQQPLVGLRLSHLAHLGGWPCRPLALRHSLQWQAEQVGPLEDGTARRLFETAVRQVLLELGCVLVAQCHFPPPNILIALCAQSGVRGPANHST